MELDDPTSWRADDPAPGVALNDISPLNIRAAALLARNMTHVRLGGNFMRVGGAVDIIDALQYHFDNMQDAFGKLDQRLRAVEDYHATLKDVKPGEQRSVDPEVLRAITPTANHQRWTTNAIHEVVAYINRVGQYYYFTKSSFVESALGGSQQQQLGTINRLKNFRHKFSAHRSIDKPTGESAEFQSLQALSLHGQGGLLWRPTPSGRIFIFQIRVSRGRTEQFVPQEDHPEVMTEAYGILERLFV